MKKYSNDIIISVCLFFLTVLISILTIINGDLEIQIHDTYLALNFIYVDILTIGPLTFMIFLIRAFIKKFKIIQTNIGLSVGIFFMILITIGFLKFENNYINELLTLHPQNFTDVEKIVDKNINLKNWTWGFLCFWITCFAFVTYRTVRIWIKSVSVSPKD